MMYKNMAVNQGNNNITHDTFLLQFELWLQKPILKLQWLPESMMQYLFVRC
jgi:hypothetical protein